MEETKDRKVTECDGKGCETACCFGCSCCMARKGIIEEKEKEIDGLKQKILELMARSTTISGDEALRKENEELNAENKELKCSLVEANQTVARIRKERNG